MLIKIRIFPIHFLKLKVQPS